MRQGAYELHENKTILFSSKNINISVIIFGFTGCINTIIWYPATVYGASAC